MLHMLFYLCSDVLHIYERSTYSVLLYFEVQKRNYNQPTKVATSGSKCCIVLSLEGRAASCTWFGKDNLALCLSSVQLLFVCGWELHEWSFLGLGNAPPNLVGPSVAIILHPNA